MSPAYSLPIPISLIGSMTSVEIFVRPTDWLSKDAIFLESVKRMDHNFQRLTVTLFWLSTYERRLGADSEWRQSHATNYRS